MLRTATTSTNLDLHTYRVEYWSEYGYSLNYGGGILNWALELVETFKTRPSISPEYFYRLGETVLLEPQIQSVTIDGETYDQIDFIEGSSTLQYYFQHSSGETYTKNSPFTKLPPESSLEKVLRSSLAPTPVDYAALIADAQAELLVPVIQPVPTELNDNSYTVPEDGVLDVPAPGVKDNDTGNYVHLFDVVALTDPAHGSLALNGDGSFTYAPDPDFNGVDTFTYGLAAPDFVTDGGDTVTVTIEVVAVNDPPLAEADGPYTGVVGEPIIHDGSGSSDPDGTIVLYEWDFDDDGVYDWSSATSGVATHTYWIDGTHWASLRVTDNNGLADTDVATVAVQPANAPPVARDDAYSTDEDTPLTIPAPGLMGNDSDADGDQLFVSTYEQPSVGTVVVAADGSFSYTPDVNFNGTDAFAYTVCDLNGACDTAAVTVTVVPVNDPPVADPNGPYEGYEGTAIPLDASGSHDPDGTIIAYEWDLDADGEYDDAAGVSPSVVFADNGLYVVGLLATDESGGVDTDEAVVTVDNVPPAVDAGPDATIDEGSTFSSAGSFTDPGADTWTATVDYGDGSGPQPLAINPDKTFTLSHVYADNGSYAVTQTVTPPL
jgi:VCBS repeat-containing protein